MIDIFTLLVPIIIVLGSVVLWSLRPKDEFEPPKTKAFNPRIFQNFYLRRSLFVNKSEEALFAILYNRLVPRYRIFSKVRLEDIIAVKPNRINAKVSWSLRGRVKSRHVDFLVTTPQGLPLMIIELDGASHNSAAAHRPDAFKNGLAKSVGLPLRRIKVGQSFHKFTQKIDIELSQS